MFKTTTIVDFSDNAADGRTVLELVTADRPGLLSTVGQTFISHGIDIAAAKIMTIGERAEDVFYIRDLDGKPLGPKAREKLRAALIGELDDNNVTV